MFSIGLFVLFGTLFQPTDALKGTPLTIPLAQRSAPFENPATHRSPYDYGLLRDSLRARYGYGKAKREAVAALAAYRHDLARRRVETLEMTNLYWDTSYFALVDIGTPPQRFNLILDTGSSETWVLGRNCSGCTGGDRFDSSQSSTYDPQGRSVRFSYGSGDVVGTVAYESISVGGFSLEHQIIATINEQNILQGSVSGILGLAWPGLMSTRNELPWWIRLIRDGQLGEGETMMSFWFSRYWGTRQTQDTIETPGGQFTLGGTNSSLYTGEINYVPLIDVNWWTIAMDGVVVNGAPLDLTDIPTYQPAIIDTGTTLVGGPSEVLDAIFDRVEGAVSGAEIDRQLEGYYLIPCSAIDTLELAFTFGGHSYAFEGIDLVMDDASDILSGYCFSSLFVLGSLVDVGTGPAWLIGAAFLKNVYSVFRFEDLGDGSATGSVGFGVLSNVDGRLFGSAPRPSGTDGASTDLSESGIGTGVLPPFQTDTSETMFTATSDEDDVSPSSSSAFEPAPGRAAGRSYPTRLLAALVAPLCLLFFSTLL